MNIINKKLLTVFLMLAFVPLACASDFRDVNLSAFEDDDITVEELMLDEDDVGIKNTQTIDLSQTAKAAKIPPVSVTTNTEYLQNSVPAASYEIMNSVKDNNDRLYGVVGKSQVITFDSSISRVSITNNDIADIVVLSPTQILINGKSPGATSVIFWGGNDKPMFYNLVIQRNADSFLQAVEHVAPNENVSIIFNEKGAVLSGHVSSTAVKQRINELAKAYNINLTDVTESPAKQVLLEVKITEVSKNLAREMGLKMISGRGIDFTGQKIGSGDSAWEIKGNTNKTIDVIETGAGFVFGMMTKGKYLFGFDASEAKGDIKVLAEPKLLAVHGEQGEFSIGNQVPVPSGMGQYGNVSYSYKDTGVILKFKPLIMEDSNRVRLELNPEVSEVDDSVSVASSQGLKVYGFKTRKVNTTVELNSGETLVIAGLLQNSSSRSRTQVPILGNIPIIGNLFSFTSDDKRDTDLMIFITPRIIDNSTTTYNL